IVGPCQSIEERVVHRTIRHEPGHVTAGGATHGSESSTDKDPAIRLSCDTKNPVIGSSGLAPAKKAIWRAIARELAEISENRGARQISKPTSGQHLALVPRDDTKHRIITYRGGHRSKKRRIQGTIDVEPNKSSTRHTVFCYINIASNKNPPI